MFYADLHIHSHFSRATSKDLDLPHLQGFAAANPHAPFVRADVGPEVTEHPFRVIP